MSILFIDGFDEYLNPANTWDGVGAANQGSNDLTGTKSRTGVGCYVTNGPFGPFKAVQNKNQLVMGVAAFCVNIPGGQVFGLFSGGISGTIQTLVGIQSNGQIFVQIGAGAAQFSNPGVIIANAYQYIELQITISAGSGSYVLRVNGATILTASGINTDPAGSGFVDAVQLRGAGGGSTLYFDDFYLFDTTGGVNNSLAGPVKIYTALPTSDNAPLQWTPSTPGTHFNLVNGVPAENQVTFVSSGTIGQADDYLYNLSSVPSNVTILGVQHRVDALLDAAGSGSVGSDCGNGHVIGSVALNTTPHLFSFPRDTDPVVAGPWTLTNLISRQFGPSRTA